MSDNDPWLSGIGPWQFNAYAWPQKGVYTPCPWGRYAYGFKEAGDRLVAGILEGQRGGLDVLLMPILALYRHYIELTAKVAVRDLRRHLSIDAPLKFNHRLDLWAEMFRLAAQLAEEPSPGFPEADRLVAELQTHDPAGDAFRFPEFKDGTPSTPRLENVNIARLAEGMGHVEAAIGWVEWILIQASDCAQERWAHEPFELG